MSRGEYNSPRLPCSDSNKGTRRDVPYAVGMFTDISERYGGTDGMLRYLASIPMCDREECMFARGDEPYPKALS